MLQLFSSNPKKSVRKTKATAAAELAVPTVIPKDKLNIFAGVNVPTTINPISTNLDGVIAANKFREVTKQLEISKVSFNFFSSDELRKLSVIECNDDGTEGKNTVNSPNMGSDLRTERCGTCGLYGIECPGHLGRIELAAPIFHPMAIDYILIILSSICSNCGRLLLSEVKRNDPALLKLPLPTRLKEIYKSITSSNYIICPHNLELSTKKNTSESKHTREEINQNEEMWRSISNYSLDVSSKVYQWIQKNSELEASGFVMSEDFIENRRKELLDDLNLNFIKQFDDKNFIQYKIFKNNMSEVRTIMFNINRCISVLQDLDEILSKNLKMFFNNQLVHLKSIITSLENEDISQEFCPSNMPKYSFPKNSDAYQIMVTKKSSIGGGKKIEVTNVITPEKVKTLFNSITPEDLKVMGFYGNSHPRNFVVDVWPVIPERNRPPADRDGEIKHDHITIVYQMILRENKRLKEAINKQKKELAISKSNESALSVSYENDISLLKRSIVNLIHHLINNDDKKLTIRHGEVARTFSTRLTGKEGFCRANSQGKRTNYACRTVAGPGIVPFGGLILPMPTRILTISERVHVMNYDKILRLAEHGKIIHFTEGSGRPQAGIRKRYAVASALAIERGLPPPEIKIGDLVERLAETGDDVFVNRQPTLHRHSMIGCRAIYSANKTTRSHMSYTKPMNMDFD